MIAAEPSFGRSSSQGLDLMRPISKFALAGAAISAAALAFAAPASATTYVFTETGFNNGGGTLQGTFSTNATGAVGLSDLTSFNASFSGNNATSAFVMSLGDLAAFSYNTGTNSLAITEVTNTALVLLSSISAVVISPNTGNAQLPQYSSSTNGPLTVVASSGGSAAPEPAAWGLMILGFGAIGGAMRTRRNVKVSFA
jgi:hypothetical protein